MVSLGNEKVTVKYKSKTYCGILRELTCNTERTVLGDIFIMDYDGILQMEDESLLNFTIYSLRELQWQE